ncbi:transporter [Halalkalibacillus sediminis]|uniref:Transporter n=1 Tax=Halalkalibacillus sediminis TaxID=2018042 RepID=A0A2I0QUZ3_9BACI|nr:transporter [Halalkalibacillus sediminis]
MEEVEEEETQEKETQLESNPTFEKQVVTLVNQVRKEHGLDPLQQSQRVGGVARDKSIDMAEHNYFSHQSPNYGSPFDMLEAYGISYRAAGENIAMGQGSPEQVMDSWMNSEGHRKNILSENFNQLGVGFIKEDGQTYWTQIFISN